MDVFCVFIERAEEPSRLGLAGDCAGQEAHSELTGAFTMGLLCGIRARLMLKLLTFCHFPQHFKLLQE